MLTARSLKFRIVLVLEPVLTIFMIGAILLLYIKNQHNIVELENAKIETATQVLSEAAASAALVGNITALDSLLKAAQRDADFEAGVIGVSERYLALMTQRAGAK